MERQCLGAYTAPGCEYPPYVSVNQTGDVVEITARGPSREGHEGPCATVPMPLDEFTRWLAEMNARWCQVPRVVDDLPKPGA